MSEFLQALPLAAGSPYALAAYAVAAIIFITAGSQLRKTRILAAHIKDVPDGERRRALEISAGTVLPTHITPAQWLRLKKMQWTVLLLLSFLIAVIVVSVIAIQLRTRSAETVERSQQELLTKLQLGLSPLREASIDAEVLLNPQSTRMAGAVDNVRKLFRELSPGFDEATDTQEGGWKVERTADLNGTRNIKRAWVDISESVLGDRNRFVIARDAQLHFYFVRESTLSDDALRKNLTEAGTVVAFVAAHGSRSVGINPHTGEVFLVVRGATVQPNKDQTKFSWATASIASLVDLKGMTLVVAVVPWASNEVDYERWLWSEPFLSARDVQVRMAARVSLRVPNTEWRLMTPPGFDAPPRQRAAIPSEAKEFKRWLVGS